MDTKTFLGVIKGERGWDVAPQLSLLGAYGVTTFLFTVMAGVQMTTSFLVGGFAIGLYTAFKPKVLNSIIKWWNHFSFTFHATLIIVEVLVLIGISKALALTNINNDKNQ